MTFKELIRFSYGLVMGTSTPYLKPRKRFLFPTHFVELDPSLTLLLGGSGICGLLSDGRETLVINTNQGAAATELASRVESHGGTGRITVVLSSTARDFSAGLVKYDEAQEIFVGPMSEKDLRRDLGAAASRCKRVFSETVLDVAGERVHLIPVGPAATSSDLAVFCEKRGILFAGPLFYNRVHPILRPGPGLKPELWVAKLETLLERFKPSLIVPAEGDTATTEETREFIRYLKDLMNPEVEFSSCRRDYDWPEIPSYTSLEENFDLLRENTKTYTSLGR